MATTAVPAEAPPEDTPPPAKAKKRLLLIAGAVALVLLLAAAGGGFWWFSKKAAQRSAEDAELAEQAGDDEEAVAAAEARRKRRDEKRHAPVFLPLEMFTVNLADREAERYAQVGVTLELADTKTSDLLKAYMPAVRNDVLMLIAHKTASELQERAGKLQLASEIRRAALKPIQDEVDEQDAAEDAPVRAVHFSSFIIQ